MAAVKNLGQYIMCDPASFRVGRQSLWIVNLNFSQIKMSVGSEEALAKFVPAAAVTRIVQVFNLLTRCTRQYRGLIKLNNKK